MKWWIVVVEEFSGYDCDGHDVKHIIMAHSAEEAVTYAKEKIYCERVYSAVELTLPDPSRHRKPKKVYVYDYHDNPNIRIY